MFHTAASGTEQSIAQASSAIAEVHDDTADEAISGAVAQPSKPTKVVGVDIVGGLALDSDDRTVVALEDEIDHVTVAVAPVERPDGPTRPQSYGRPMTRARQGVCLVYVTHQH